MTTMLRFSQQSTTITLTPRRSIFIPRAASRPITTTMTAYKPNTEPPKTVSVFRNIYQVASDSDKFRRVLWTGRNSQVRSFLYAAMGLSLICYTVAGHHDHSCRWRSWRGEYMRIFGSVPELTSPQETHTVDQHLNFLSGTAEAIIDGGAKVWRMDHTPRWADR